MTAKDKEMFQALHPDPSKHGARVTKKNYDAYREALMQVIPASEAGIPFMDLSQAVQPHVPADILADTSSGWWVTTVKLDLEARGLIERVPTKGKQRVRKVTD